MFHLRKMHSVPQRRKLIQGRSRGVIVKNGKETGEGRRKKGQKRTLACTVRAML